MQRLTKDKIQTL